MRETSAKTKVGGKLETMCTESTFFDKDYFQDLVSALIGMGGALLIFYLTLKNDKKKEDKKNKETNKNRIRHFSNLSNSSTNHIETIIYNLNEMIAKYDVDELTFQLLPFSPNKSLDRIEKLLKNENYFLAYVDEFGDKKVKTFNNISFKIDFFIMQVEQIWEMIKASQKFDYERKIKFKNQVNELMNSTAWLTKQSDILSVEDIDEIGKMITDFYDDFTNGNDLEYYYKFIRKVLEDVLINYTDNKTVLEILPQFRTASNLFIEIKAQNTNHKGDLKEIVQILSTTLVKYKEETKDLH